MCSTGPMKTSTKNLLFGILALVVAVIVASVIVNVALTFLAAAIKFALIALVALLLLGVGWVSWARVRSRD
jgi:uncharacterized protein YacL